MSKLIDPEEYQDYIGTTQSDNLGRITRKDVRRYARAVEDNNPLFWEVEYAQEHGYDDLVVPPNMPASILEIDAGTPADDLQEDGLPPSLGVDPEFPEDVLTMKGERELTFHRYATAGDRITRQSTFEDIYQKQGSSAGTLTFTVATEEYVVDEEVILTNNQTHIHYNSE